MRQLKVHKRKYRERWMLPVVCGRVQRWLYLKRAWRWRDVTCLRCLAKRPGG